MISSSGGSLGFPKVSYAISIPFASAVRTSMANQAIAPITSPMPATPLAVQGWPGPQSKRGHGLPEVAR